MFDFNDSKSDDSKSDDNTQLTTDGEMTEEEGNRNFYTFYCEFPERICGRDDARIKVFRKHLTDSSNRKVDPRAAMMDYIERLLPGKWLKSSGSSWKGWFEVENISGWRDRRLISPNDTVKCRWGEQVEIMCTVLECRINVFVDASGALKEPRPAPFVCFGEKYYNVEDGVYQLVCYRRTEHLTPVFILAVDRVIGTLIIVLFTIELIMLHFECFRSLSSSRKRAWA